MVGVRVEIERTQRCHSPAALVEIAQIAGKRRRIARDIGDGPGTGVDQLLDYRLAGTGARRVQDEGVEVPWLLPQHPLNTALDDLDLAGAVQVLACVAAGSRRSLH